MATTIWTSFYPYVQPYLPGCPEIVIESHLQETAADFIDFLDLAKANSYKNMLYLIR